MTETYAQAGQVKELRDMTGAGFMDCKQALLDAKGDLEQAKDLLRKKGLASADKRASRDAKDGIVFVSCSGSIGAMLELNSETDFVARTEEFQKLGERILADVSKQGEKAIESEATQSVTREASGKIGEKIAARRAICIETKQGAVVQYRHHNAKIGILVELEFSKPELAKNQDVLDFGKNVAMQIAALRTPFLNRDQITPEFMEREKAIFREQVKDKPANVQDKIIQGKIQKRFEEICLIDQKSIVDPSKSIAQLAQALSQKVGSPVSVKQFVRFEIGIE